MGMTKNRLSKICLTLSTIYILLAIFIFDWSFRMTPSADIDSKTLLNIFVCIYLAIEGGLLLIAYFGMSKGREYGSAYFKYAFWSGLTLLVIGSLVGGIMLLKNFPIGTIQVASAMGLFYLPLAIVYLWPSFRNRGETK